MRDIQCGRQEKSEKRMVRVMSQSAERDVTSLWQPFKELSHWFLRDILQVFP